MGAWIIFWKVSSFISLIPEILGRIIESEVVRGILCDIGMPVVHKNVLYNCRIIVHDGKIVLIRPKMWLANDGNYRELRYFTPWQKHRQTEEHYLPRMIGAITGQVKVPFGDAVISTMDTCIGVELCEELFTPASPHILMGLDGVEIFTNSSGSHHELRKLYTRVELIKEATLKLGGIYLYANQQGCDGDRLYYDGCAMIAVNGRIVAQGSQFSLSDVEVVSATVDIEDVRAHRTRSSRSMQAAEAQRYPRIEVPMPLSGADDFTLLNTAAIQDFKVRYHTPEEEIGYFVPLSGGIDSCATAVIVYSMSRLVSEAANKGDTQVITDARRMCGEPEISTYTPTDPREFTNRIFHTCYMGTENSSSDTRQRAKALSEAIGSYHVDLNMDSLVTAVRNLFAVVTGHRPQFRAHGGSNAENLALQNIQARLRMVLAYLFAQLLPWVRGKMGGLLVLGIFGVTLPSMIVHRVSPSISKNAPHASINAFIMMVIRLADINPIGGISKTDLKKFIRYAQDSFDLPILSSFLDAVPTAELEPITESYVQADEADMGMTYDELSVFGRLRKVEKCGPYSMFCKLIQEWGSMLSPTQVRMFSPFRSSPVNESWQQIADKVKLFFFEHARNRHKMTTLTPSYHAADRERHKLGFDLRPFLYNARFPFQFAKIDDIAKKILDRSTAQDEVRKED
ncbi:glutamine-dependent NAD(+) synthetase synthase [Rhizoctonia solani AG-1 IA]|uniref:Glutamine-dependent NAD(+) synthetase n=1 Tax=Thanatephorus cucumeris (strain AG1-IA) TaxID=983506 RepID=L8X4I3_THACA|nr:glutamine-dependent NAD(+) synthetase synthase [Rhizoctonia solani AG-1 IA]